MRSWMMVLLAAVVLGSGLAMVGRGQGDDGQTKLVPGLGVGDEKLAAEGEKLNKMGQQLAIMKKTIDDLRSEIRTFRQSNSLSSIGSAQHVEVAEYGRLLAQLNDATVRLHVDEGRLDRMKKRSEAGVKVEGMDAAEETLADERVTVDTLQKMVETDARKLQDLDYLMQVIAEKSAELSALQAACLELEVKLAVETAAVKAGL